MFRIGIDIGGTKINIGILDFDSKKLVDFRKIAVKAVNSITESIKGTVLELCSANGISISDITACGIGIPGTVSGDGKKIIKAPNISILTDTLAEDLEKELSVPVILVQDSRAAAYGEYIASGEKYKTLVCVTLGTGIGTGIVMNGKIFSGSLGAAGELGHLPVKENGRPCGCGKRGCLEKYCAGGGLDITAAEILGEGKNAHDLFNAAKSENSDAVRAINEAILMLGGGLVSIINLLSPDCILFSGGLSAQEDLYLNPLIEYIKAHCYTAGEMPELRKAELAEFSPLYGAAFVPKEIKGAPPMLRLTKAPMLSASIMCADILNLGNSLEEIKRSGIEYLHCDIMDNHFVPNLMMPMEFLNKIRPATNMPCDFHLMTEKPETVIEKLDVKAGDIISIHYESTPHVQRVITLIKEKGAMAAVAINPATPISVLEEIITELDMVLIMSVNPGFAGQKIVPTSFEKIRKMKKYLSQRGLDNVLIEVDGNCSFENVPKMYEAGADIFVVGTSSVFKTGLTIEEGVRKLRETLI